MATPSWQAATAGQPQLASAVNQLLGTHAVTYLYAGASQGGHTTLGTGGVSSNGLYVAQSFTAGSSFLLGRVVLDFAALTGTPTGLATVSIQTSSGGAPSGTALVSTSVPALYLSGLVSIPVPCPLSSGTGYWIVLSAVGDASDYVTWLESNQTSGASTSTSGTSWTAQAYGMYYSYWDQSAVPPLAHTWEDAGARWTAWAENAGNQPTSLQECTVAQGAGQYVYSSRTLTYSGTSLTTVA